MRILECGELVAAPYAAKLLAHLGAVKVEPRGGDPARRRGPFPRGEAHLERSGLHLYLNQAKRSVVSWIGRAPPTSSASAGSPLRPTRCW
jgi:crotonobetainyl-CoA:carnitine CoA-transferase CaiB-like acyl-CoA transferase